jgi:hypothetical protein
MSCWRFYRQLSGLKQDKFLALGCRLLAVKRIVIFVLMGLSTSMGQRAHEDQQAHGSAWMLDYHDKSENELARDKRFASFLKENLPTVGLPSWHDQPINTAAMDFLGGVPGMLEVKHERYIVLSGCPAHACVARAMLWVDLQVGTTVFVATANENGNADPTTRDQYNIGSANLFIAAKAEMTANTLPDSLKGAIIQWLHREGVLRLGQITLFGATGSVPVTTDQLCWAGSCAWTRWE